VECNARDRVLESLCLSANYAELEAIRAGNTQLEKRKEKAQRTIVAFLECMAVEALAHVYLRACGGTLDLPSHAAEARPKCQRADGATLLAASAIGQEILQAETEKDRQLDPVWLAQIKRLWTSVGALLEEEPTSLEREALAIKPVKEA
jgi:hypothetical protein